MENEETTLLDQVESLRADQRKRWENGERVLVESYLPLHPSLFDDAESAVQILYNEVLLRESFGEHFQLEEYVERFPQFAAQLAPLFEVHRALDSDQFLGIVSEMGAPGEGAPHNATKSGPWPTIEGFEIVGELGRGGMGVVYKARQKALNRLVAIKVILAGQHADPNQLARFRAEAIAVARIHHPNIVQIHAVGEQDGWPYFCMELVDGPSLAQVLKSTPQPADQAATLIAVLARAIHTAHEQGIVHRDLKPANILLQGVGSDVVPNGVSLVHRSGADCVPKIADFGLAKQVDLGTGRTSSGMIVGTPSYMAPEQANGKIREIGPAADIYALGAILYELLSGRPPFKAETQLDTLHQIFSTDPVPLSRFHLNVPRDLDTICTKCLQKEPHKRYRSGLALAEDLENFLANRPILARRTSVSERTWRWCRRNPAVALLVASVVFLLLFLAGGASVAALRLRRELVRTEKAEQAAQEEKETAIDQLWNASFSQAQALRRSGHIGQRFVSLEAIQQASRITHARGSKEAEVLALRSEAIACLALTDLHTWKEWEIPNWRPFASFDGALETYACPDAQGNIHVGRTVDQQEIAYVPAPDKPADSIETDFSPDGRFLLANYNFGKNNLNVVWQLSVPTAPRRVLRVGDGLARFTPDSQSLAVAQHDGTLNFYDLADGSKCRKLMAGFRADQMAFRPDGKQLAHADDRTREVRILDTATRQVLRNFPSPGASTALAWSRDGRLLAAASNKRIYIWDATTGLQHAMLEGSRGLVMALRFNPDGQLLASTGWDDTTRIWDVGSGKALVNSPGRLLNFSPDGRRLGFQRGMHMGIWEVEDGLECRLLRPQLERTADWMNYQGQECIDFSPDGRILASVGGDGVRLWDTTSAAELAHLAIGYHEAAVFRPSGGRLFTYGRTGLKSWPMTRVPGNSGIQIGDPQTYGVPKNSGWFHVCCSQDGQVLVVTNDGSWQIIILKADEPSERITLSGCRDVVSMALSADGKWLAAGMVKGKVGIGIWDARSGRLAHRFPIEKDGSGHFQVAFSPDCRWLLTGGARECRFWEVGSWAAGAVIARDYTGAFGGPSGPFAFSKDGRLLAMARSHSLVQLFDLVRQRELATFTDPDGHAFSRLCFNPDGTQLAASTYNHVIHIWNLPAIRRRLADMGLDWDLPP